MGWATRVWLGDEEGSLGMALAMAGGVPLRGRAVAVRERASGEEVG